MKIDHVKNKHLRTVLKRLGSLLLAVGDSGPSSRWHIMFNKEQCSGNSMQHKLYLLHTHNRTAQEDVFFDSRRTKLMVDSQKLHARRYHTTNTRIQLVYDFLYKRVENVHVSRFAALFFPSTSSLPSTIISLDRIEENSSN